MESNPKLNPFRQSVDTNSPIAYYLQLKDEIVHVIEQGVWKPGDQIPGEADLCQMFGVSRTVVRRALDELEYEGRINRIKGKGTFVTEHKVSGDLAQKLTGFYQDMVRQGLTPFTQVLRREVVPASPEIAAKLAIPPGAPVFDMERLRFVQDVPLVLVRNYIPYDLCPALQDADLSRQSLYAFLENRYGLVIASGRRIIEAMAASEAEAALLQISVEAALLVVTSVVHLDDGRPIEFFRALYRGDRARLEVELIR